MPDIEKSLEEWRKDLDPETFRITRQKGTEAPFTGQYYQHKETGVYHCSCCGQPLFTSSGKYDSGSGWPSFWQPVSDAAVVEISDTSLGMVRTEIACKACGAHLGHVFEDGPQPTGQRYCVNSACLKFNADETARG